MAMTDGGQLMKLGDVAAQNIARALGWNSNDKAAIKHVESAIADEINAMSSHFTLAFADIQTQYEIEIAKIRSSWNFMRDRPLFVGVASFVAFMLGAVFGKIV